ncbi:MAG: 30S ribosomal protein S20 [Verrucomicrobiota bacterium]|nr:30S ribosomal protein S20 [Verrucomicrobiota bacterium]
MAEQQAQKAPDKKKEGKQKRPSALKRNLQSEKRRLRNRSYEAKVHTAIRHLEQALSEKQPKEAIQSRLNSVFSLVDKGVKHGVYKRQKASRTKSRLSNRVSA